MTDAQCITYLWCHGMHMLIIRDAYLYFIRNAGKEMFILREK